MMIDDLEMKGFQNLIYSLNEIQLLRLLAVDTLAVYIKTSPNPEKAKKAFKEFIKHIPKK